MLKKVISLLLIVACCFTTTAFAEGKLKATEKNLIVYGTESYFFAKVENVGDAPIATGNGDLVVFTEDDEILFSTNYVSTLPSDVVLQPGESLFVRDSEWEDALETNPVTDYKFSISPSNYSADTIIQVPSEATFEYSEEDPYDNYVYVTLTNTTDAPVSNFYVVAALRDLMGKAVESDEYKTQIESLGMQYITLYGDELNTFINEQMAFYKDICADIDING